MNEHCVVMSWWITDVLMEVMKLTHHLNCVDGSVGNRSFVGTIVTVCLSPTCLPSDHLMVVYNRHSIICYFKNFLFLFFWPCCTAYGILVPQPGIRPVRTGRLGMRAWAGWPASLSLSVHVSWTGIAAAWSSPGDEMTDAESTCLAHSLLHTATHHH